MGKKKGNLPLGASSSGAASAHADKKREIVVTGCDSADANFTISNTTTNNTDTAKIVEVTAKVQQDDADALFDKRFRKMTFFFILVHLIFYAASLVINFKQGPLYYEIAQLSNGYGAKLSCSLVFLANRSQSSIDYTELLFPPIIFASQFSVDYENKCVTGVGRLNSSITQTACFRNRQLGCVLMNSAPGSISKSDSLWSLEAPIDDNCAAFTENTSSRSPTCEASNDLSRPWPFGEARSAPDSRSSAFDGVNMTRIDELVSYHFAHTSLHARAFLLIRNGELIYEKYGDGAGPETPMIGWSMTKSLTSTLLGIRSYQTGGFNLSTDIRRLNDQWTHNTSDSSEMQDHSDASGPHFSLGRMLRMSEGLDFDEKYEQIPGKVTRMLFTAPATSDVMPVPVRRAAASSRACFHYSSLTTNLLQKYLKRTFDDRTDEYLNFPQTQLFDRINVRSATIETDPSNVFVGSSFSYMRARDWAKLGLLWLNDGVWPSFPLTRSKGAEATDVESGLDNGKINKLGGSLGLFEGLRMLPEGWMDFARSPTSTSNGVYGAHFWLGGNDREEEAAGDAHSKECDLLFPTRVKPPKTWLRDSFPAGTFLAHGFEEQVVAMVPKKGLVMVRLGASKEVVLMWEKEKISFYKGIMDSISDIY